MIKDDKKEEVLKRFKKALSNYSELYSEQYEFTQKQLEFASGDMWEDSVASARIRDNRPNGDNKLHQALRKQDYKSNS